MNMTISWFVGEAIHPPLDRQSQRAGKRFDKSLIFLAKGLRRSFGQSLGRAVGLPAAQVPAMQ
ncbi:hypothetical protein ACFX5Q_15670 [Mesorhizobium sp. IMUNJ 23033]|uniref:hypothetical protein n=1 Tax=Mesorhizobium sp. IMUNJ 23033 TaxID=3378039 RepID=UPI00384C1C17